MHVKPTKASNTRTIQLSAVLNNTLYCDISFGDSMTTTIFFSMCTVNFLTGNPENLHFQSQDDKFSGETKRQDSRVLNT